MPFGLTSNLEAGTMENTKTEKLPYFTLIILLGSCFSSLYAQPNQGRHTAVTSPNQPDSSQNTAEPRPSLIKVADFYLRDGRFVTGRVVSEDKNKIIMEQLQAGKIIVSTYGKREIENRTLRPKTIPEWKYYLDIGDYFSARTWDFVDDPDDFIQALRSYEKAKLSAQTSRRFDHEQTGQIREKIEKLQADRQIWSEQIRSRAQLKKLEFEATAKDRLQAAEQRAMILEQKLEEVMARLETVAAQIDDKYLRLERIISDIEKDLLSQLQLLDQRIESNRDLIERGRYYPRRRYPQ
jgi:hypothetical protein